MVAQKKIDQVKNLTEKLKEAKSVVFVNYQGLTHEQLALLRKKLKEVGGFLMVTKNTLLKLALKSSHHELPTTSHELSGPTATLFIPDDPIPPLKVLANFLNEFSLPEIKMGIFEGELVSKERALRLATLPPREVLAAQVVGGLKAPTQRLAFSLAWNLQKLTHILKSISEQSNSKWK